MVLKYLEGIDLIGLHTWLSLFGASLAVYLMQLTSYESEDGVDPLPIRWARRISLALTGLTLLSGVLYSEAKGWQPWPPYLALVTCVVLTLGIRTIAIRARIWREGSRHSVENSMSKPVLNRDGKFPTVR